MSKSRRLLLADLSPGSFLWRLAFVGCALAVLGLALLPAPPPELSTGWDKSNHLLAFAVQAWLGCHAYPQRRPAVLLGLLAFGGLIELLQWFTPTREADWPDVVADGLGILIGWLLWRMGKPGRPVSCADIEA